MPYGISKSLGGDSPANDAKMERQVAAIERSGQSKVSAIKIAKASMEKHAHGSLTRTKSAHRRLR